MRPIWTYLDLAADVYARYSPLMFSMLISIFWLAHASSALPVPITSNCSVTDGDTIRCGDERIRLLAIDAPELPGHCRPGRDCAPGDPIASTDALRRLTAHKTIMIKRVGEDRYGRTLGVLYVDGINLSCAQIASGHAIYVRRWDDRGQVRGDCPSLAR